MFGLVYGRISKEMLLHRCLPYRGDAGTLKYEFDLWPVWAWYDDVEIPS
jgi:hypothetical protein